MRAISFKSILLVAVGMLVGMTMVNAQSLGKMTKPSKAERHKKTAQFLNKTNDILFEAGNTVKSEKVYTGYLHEAKKRQQASEELLKKGNYRKSMKKSYIARRYAFMAVEANKGEVKKEWKLDKNEENVMKRIMKKKVTNENLKKRAKKTSATSKKAESKDVKDNKKPAKINEELEKSSSKTIEKK